MTHWGEGEGVEGALHWGLISSRVCVVIYFRSNDNAKSGVIMNRIKCNITLGRYKLARRLFQEKI